MAMTALMLEGYPSLPLWPSAAPWTYLASESHRRAVLSLLDSRSTHSRGLLWLQQNHLHARKLGWASLERRALSKKTGSTTSSRTGYPTTTIVANQKLRSPHQSSKAPGIQPKGHNIPPIMSAYTTKTTDLPTTLAKPRTPNLTFPTHPYSPSCSTPSQNQPGPDKHSSLTYQNLA